jgi:dehydrogenase/reductase SDR family protein 12
VTRLHEQIETALPIEATFPFIADFANSEVWDPGVSTALRIGDGPVGVGTRYRLGVHLGRRVAPMEYQITVFEPPNRVVLAGSGSGVSAVDEIRFERSGRGTRIDYVADIRLEGRLRLIQPFLGGAFARLARNAAGGMLRVLDERATRDRSDRS